MIKKNIVLTIFIILSIFLSNQTVFAEKKLKVVSTVAPITNIIHNVGGNRIDLHGIIPEGMDSHTFEPIPSDIKYIAEADLIILNGMNLETPTEKLAKSRSKKGSKILKLGDNTVTKKEWLFDFSFPEDKGDPNPHLWLNVAYAMKYAELVRDKLIEMNPENREYYKKNTNKFLKKLEQLDKAIFQAVKTIPEKNRKLLTYHDSWAYFAKRYDMKVIGAIQPSDFAEPSPREIAAIIDQLKKENVPAIFGSEVYPSKVEEQIAKEAKIKHVTTLRDDDLPGKLGSKEHTYIGMMLDNMREMIAALGGKADAFSAIDPSNIIED
ncbi:MAG: zinc ABC transporter substrate-binding protein [Nitrospirae bacterium]|nr:zinc ABC transporter substrate-binding protein [Nitrospirota bacterium]